MAIHVNDGKYLFFSDDDGPNLKVSAYGEQADILWLFYKFIPFYFMFILIMLIIWHSTEFIYLRKPFLPNYFWWTDFVRAWEGKNR